jgi:hypothetical protein
MATTDDSDWSISKKSPLKPHAQMIRNLVGSIYGKFSYKDCSFCPNRRPAEASVTVGDR